VAALVALGQLAACGSDADERSVPSGSSVPSSTTETTTGSTDPSAERPPWCDDLLAASLVLPDGGTVADYEALLARVAATGPPEFAPTWELLLAASAEPFSYDTFNPAVDALDRIAADVLAACPWFGGVVVDDHGRLRRHRPDA
jgi:hypothetical protein